MTKSIEKLAVSYAAKWSAEHGNAEPPVFEEPTDEAFMRCFGNCVRPAKVSEFEAIRAVVLKEM